eukprot:CCRYP_020338-RB/>CCRYP_020338-RB protein AED:0.01 eAED:0.01 QI:332/1/1/1/1/0.75/4/1621/808
MSKQTKSNKPTQNGIYGRLPPKTKSRGKEKSVPNSDNQKSLLRTKNKMESAAKKSGLSCSGKSLKLKAKTNHHVAKVSRKTIQERINLVANKKSSKVAKDEKRVGKFSLGCHSKSSSHPPKKKRKSKTERIEFQMNITDSNHDYYLRPENVPWYKAEEQERFQENFTPCREYAKSDSTQNNFRSQDEKEVDDDKERLQLPSDQVLSQFDAEILSFCAYVKLTPSERKARTSFLGHIAGILTSQFSNRGRGVRSYRQLLGCNRNEDSAVDEAKDKVYVEPFGSFATQEVCTFASDVDMCLWGLVEKEEKSNSHVRFVSCDHNDEDEDDMGKAGFLNTNQHSECPLLTESSLLRTMDAIQCAAQGKKPEQPKECVQNENAACRRESDVEKSEGVSNCDNCFFFIDRVGETLEKFEEEQELGRNDPHTKKDSSNCQLQGRSINVDIPTCKEQKGKAHPHLKGNSLEGTFQFVIDVDGVKELGGDVDDLPGFCNEPHDTSHGKEPSVTPKSIQNEKWLEEKPETEEQENSGNETKPIALLEYAPITGTQSQAVNDRCETEVMRPSTLLGKSKDTAIDVDDCSTGDERSEVIIVDDDDSADKLESFYSRHTGNDVDEDSNGSHSSPESFSAKLNGNDSLSVGDNSEGSDLGYGDQFNKGSILELSVTSNTFTGSADGSKQLVKPVFGPTGKTRTRVISVLQGLTNHLRRSSFTNTVECRSRARVPIINCNTRTGFEGDIAIGGHNGVDTSTYALRQVKRFYSFAPIVLVLKVVMVQQGLDKPFTGGLGSYKLYVLVAHHVSYFGEPIFFYSSF